MHSYPAKSDLTSEAAAWLAQQANEKSQRPNDKEFGELDIIKIPRAGGQYQLYIIDGHDKLGSGSASTICKAYPLSKTGEVNFSKPVAIKYVAEEKGQEAVDGLIREREALEKLGVTEGLVSLKEKPNVLGVADGVYLVMPYYAGKPAMSFEKNSERPDKKSQQDSLILQKNLQEASPLDKIDMLHQLALQLQTLHHNGLTHGDLHGANILLVNKKGGGVNAKLIDFDQSAHFKSERDLVTFSGEAPAAEQIRSPEMLLESKKGASSDIYALGLTYRAMLGDQNAYNKFEVKKNLAEKKREYEKEIGIDAIVKQYEESEAIKNNPQKKKLSADYRKNIMAEKFTPEYIAKIDREYYREVLLAKDKKFQSNLPPEIKDEFENFIKRMTAMNPQERPTIDEVANQMQVFKKKLGNVLTKPEKPVRKKRDDTAVANDLTAGNQYRDALRFLLTRMENFEKSVDRHRILVVRHKKTVARVGLEANFRGIASLYNADTSTNPKKEYESLMKIIATERDKLYNYQDSRGARSNEVQALDGLMQDAANFETKNKKAATNAAPKHASISLLRK